MASLPIPEIPEMTSTSDQPLNLDQDETSSRSASEASGSHSVNSWTMLKTSGYYIKSKTASGSDMSETTTGPDTSETTSGSDSSEIWTSVAASEDLEIVHSEDSEEWKVHRSEKMHCKNCDNTVIKVSCLECEEVFCKNCILDHIDNCGDSEDDIVRTPTMDSRKPRLFITNDPCLPHLTKEILCECKSGLPTSLRCITCDSFACNSCSNPHKNSSHAIYHFDDQTIENALDDAKLIKDIFKPRQDNTSELASDLLSIWSNMNFALTSKMEVVKELIKDVMDRIQTTTSSTHTYIPFQIAMIYKREHEVLNRGQAKIEKLLKHYAATRLQNLHRRRANFEWILKHFQYLHTYLNTSNPNVFDIHISLYNKNNRSQLRRLVWKVRTEADWLSRQIDHNIEEKNLRFIPNLHNQSSIKYLGQFTENDKTPHLYEPPLPEHRPIYGLEPAVKVTKRSFLNMPRLIFSKVFNQPAHQLSNPWGICCDSEGNFYVSDQENQCVQVFDLLGSFVRVIGLERLQRPAGVAIHPGNYLLIVDQLMCQVLVFTLEGKFVESFGQKGTGDGMFMHPEEIAVNGEGLMAVTDIENGTVQLFRSGGICAKGIYVDHVNMGGAPTEEVLLTNPRGVAFTPDNTLLITDYNNNVLIQYSLTEKIGTRKWAYEGTDIEEFWGMKNIVVDDNGNMVMIDHKNNRVKVLAPDFGLLFHVGNKASNELQIKDPSGIALTPWGEIAIVDRENNRIQLFH